MWVFGEIYGRQRFPTATSAVRGGLGPTVGPTAVSRGGGGGRGLAAAWAGCRQVARLGVRGAAGRPLRTGSRRERVVVVVVVILDFLYFLPKNI